MHHPAVRPLLILSFVMLVSATMLTAAERRGDQIRINGAMLPLTAKVAETELTAKGYHTLMWFFWDVYSAVFYAPEDRNGEGQLLADDTPRVLILHYHRDISAENIEKATEQALDENPTVKKAELRDRLNKLYACYSNVEEGDEYRIEYEPGTGTRIYLNGRLDCTIEGEDFARAFFGIWVSRYSPKPDMAAHMRDRDVD